MKKYLIQCVSEDELQKLNDFICIESLFTPGESITGKALHFGDTYTNDERVYKAALEFVRQREHRGEYNLVAVYNLHKFTFEEEHFKVDKGADGYVTVTHFPPTLYAVEISDDRITVDGKSLPIKFKSGYTFKLLKTRIGTNSVTSFATIFQDPIWSREATCVIKHVLKYGKQVLSN